MKKVDLTKVTFLDVEGQETRIDIAKQIGNFMYMQGKNIVEHELGSKIYHSADALVEALKKKEPAPDCSIEIDENEEKILLQYVEQGYPFVVQKAVKENLKEVK